MPKTDEEKFAKLTDEVVAGTIGITAAVGAFCADSGLRGATLAMAYTISAASIAGLELAKSQCDHATERQSVDMLVDQYRNYLESGLAEAKAAIVQRSAPQHSESVH